MTETVLPLPEAPQRIGPYRLVCELGRGGMGTVHLAVRDDDEYRNAVAIKLLHGGLTTAEAVARFRDERQSSPRWSTRASSGSSTGGAPRTGSPTS